MSIGQTNNQIRGLHVSPTVITIGRHSLVFVPQSMLLLYMHNNQQCNIRGSIGNGFHTLDRMYTMYTYPSYDQLLSTIGLSLETGAREARMNESGQLLMRTLVPSGPRKLVLRNS